MQYQINIFLESLNQFWLQLVNFVPRLLLYCHSIFWWMKWPSSYL